MKAIDFRFQTDISSDIDERMAPNDDMDDATPENIEKPEATAHNIGLRHRPEEYTLWALEHAV